MKICSIEGCNEKHYGKGLCRKHWRRQYKKENKERIVEQDRRYYKEHKEYIAKRQQRWYRDNIDQIKQRREDNKEHIKKRQKQYNKDHKEEISIQAACYYLEHKQEIDAWNRQYRQDNRESISARVCRYQQEHKEERYEYHKQWSRTSIGKAITKALSHNRRTLLKGLTKETIQKVYEANIEKYGILTCYLCGKPIINNDDALEHSTPLSRGGTNKFENLGVAHSHCNAKKHIKTLEEWFKKEISNE